MRNVRAILVVLAASVALSACGKNPAALPEREQRIKRDEGLVQKRTRSEASSQRPAASAAAAPGAGGSAFVAPRAPAAVSVPRVTAPTTTTPTTTPQAPAGSKPAPVSAGRGVGAIKLRTRVWGTVPVDSLLIEIINQVDPNEAVQVPLKLSGPEAVWEHRDFPQGRFTVRVQVLDKAGEPLGSGATQATVEADELTDLTLDVNVDRAPTPRPVTIADATPTPAPSATPTPAATAAPSASPSATPSGPGWGGTLGVRIEIL